RLQAHSFATHVSPLENRHTLADIGARKDNPVHDRAGRLSEPLKRYHVPMRRHLPEPLHSRLLHRYVRIESLRHRMRDDGLALLLQQFDQPLLLGDQRVDLGGFAVKEGGDKRLFISGRIRDAKRTEFVTGQLQERGSSSTYVEFV